MIGRILRRLPPTRSVLRKLAHLLHRGRVRRGRPTCGIDSPSPREPVTPYHVECSGWLHLGPDHDRIESVALVAGGATVAESRRLLRRPDVDAVLGLPDGTRTGFHLAGSAVGILEPGPRPHRADLVVRLAHEPQELTLRTIDLLVVDGEERTRDRPYGLLLDPDLDRRLERTDVYTTGAPDPLANDRCVELLLQEFEPGSSVIDLGCGVGAYGRRLVNAGHVWLGVEQDPDIARLATGEGLPVLVADATVLDVPEGAFEHVIAIEVIEHLDDPEALVREAARLASRSAVFSVPNSTAIPHLHPFVVTPWHLMEADHKSFFTPTNLTSLLRRHFDHVEVVPYGDLPIRTPEGARIHYHLLAFCRQEDGMIT